MNTKSFGIESVRSRQVRFRLKRGQNNSGGLHRQYVLAKGRGKPAGFRVRQKGKKETRNSGRLVLVGFMEKYWGRAQWDVGLGVLRSLSICNVNEAVSFIWRYLFLSFCGASTLIK